MDALRYKIVNGWVTRRSFFSYSWSFIHICLIGNTRALSTIQVCLGGAHPRSGTLRCRLVRHPRTSQAMIIGHTPGPAFPWRGAWRSSSARCTARRGRCRLCRAPRESATCLEWGGPLPAARAPGLDAVNKAFYYGLFLTMVPILWCKI